MTSDLKVSSAERSHSVVRRKGEGEIHGQVCNQKLFQLFIRSDVC